MKNIARGLPRAWSRGFISLGVVLIIVIGLAVLGGGGWYVSRQGVDMVQQDAGMAAPDQGTAERHGGKGSWTVATTTSDGVQVTLTIDPCSENDSGACFGSGRANPSTKGAITAYDLITKDDCPVFGVIVNEGEAGSYYTVSANYCGAQAYSPVRTLILNTEPSWYQASPSTIGYGSRAGMEVTIVSSAGLDTSQAIIYTNHTRDNATAFCRDYIGKVTEECIQDELKVSLKDTITADCTTGEFTNFRGERYQFLGLNPDPGSADASAAKYAIKDLIYGGILAHSGASGYLTNMAIFKALCPANAPTKPF